MLTNFFDLEGNQAVINVDVAASLQHLGDVLVVEPKNFLITIILVLVIKCELDGFTLLQLNLSCATLNKTRREVVHLRLNIPAGKLSTVVYAISQKLSPPEAW